MSVFEFDTEGATAVADEARANTIPVDELRPGFFRGIPTAVGSGVMRGGAKTFDAFTDFTRAFDSRPVMDGYRGTNRLYPNAPPQTTALSKEDVERREKERTELRNSAIDYWTPHANDVGTAGRVLGGLSEIALPLMLGGGTPLVLAPEIAAESHKELTDQGVDTNTAAAVGTAEALATSIGFKLPFLGSTLTSRLASGAAGNLALGAGSAEANKLLLESGGYKEQASQFNPFDAEARTVDLLSGLAFGGIAHLTTPSVRDAALTANNAKHFQQDTAPGIPADVNSSIAHQNAMEQAIKDLEAGDPVHVPDVTDAEFLRKPADTVLHPEAESIVRELDLPKENVKSEPVKEPGEYSVHEGELTDEQAKAFQGLRSDVPADQNLGGSGGGISDRPIVQDAGRNGEPLRVFRGASRELSAEDFKPESLGFASGKPAASLGVFFSKSHEQAAQHGAVTEHYLDMRNPKVFTAEDLPGFDSREAANAFSKQLASKGHDGIVIDASNVGGPVNYVAFRHDQVIHAPKTLVKREPPIVQFRRDAAEITKALPKVEDGFTRLWRGNRKGEIGKNPQFTNDLPGIALPFRKFYGGELSYTDVPTNRLSEFANNGVAAKNAEFILPTEYAQKATQVDGDKPAVTISNEIPEHSLEPGINAEHDFDTSEPSSIESAVAEQAIAAQDLQIPTGEIDADGMPKTVSSRQLMEQARQDVKTAKKDSKAFNAAVTCFLSAGP
jgi:hypothetical protein